MPLPAIPRPAPRRHAEERSLIYDEAIMAAYYAYCRTHPTWFVDAYLPLVELLHERGDPAPAQAAWALLLSLAVETGQIGEPGGDGEDCAVPLIRWSLRP